MSYDRTVRIPDEYEENIKLLAEADSLKPGPWMSKQILDATKARAKEVTKLRRKAGKN